MKDLLEKLVSQDVIRNFFFEQISYLLALIIGLLIGASVKIWLF